MRFMTSFSLDLLIADTEVYMKQMKELEQTVAYRFSVAHYQVFMNLAGRTQTEDPCDITGDLCKPEDHQKWNAEDPAYENISRLWQCFCFTMYGKHEECAKIALKYGDQAVVKRNPGTCLNQMEQQYKGLSYFIAARQTGKRSYQKVALRIQKRIKKWIESGCPNVMHFDALFDAEYAALQGKTHDAIKFYQAAVVLAGRRGLVMDAAMISECFAHYLLDEVDYRDEAAFRLQEAVKYYRDFGAFCKAELIELEHGDMWQKPPEVVAIHS